MITWIVAKLYDMRLRDDSLLYEI